MLVYDIDANDCITHVGGTWSAFAHDNGAPELDLVTGESLWRFVSGDDVRELYRVLMARVREGHSAQFDFRCPSPTLDRLLTMQMMPIGDDAIRFSTTPSVISSRHTTAPPPASGLIRVCSWCKRVRVHKGWEEPDFAVEALAVFTALKSAPSGAQVTHGICPACVASLDLGG